MEHAEHQSLEGQVAVITGAGSGIGQGIALALAQAGGRLSICGRRPEALDRTTQMIRQAGGMVLPIIADVSRPEDVEALVQRTEAELGPIDILVSNAGIGGGAPIHQHDIGEWDSIIATNLRGPFLLARHVLPGMRRRRHGHLIHISSESGLEHYQGDGAYGVSKHALNALGEYIQRENQDFGIRVDTVCPGMVVTEMTQGSSGLDETRCLVPADIAELIVWLLTRRSNIKIGQPILIQTMLNPWE
jgi:NAD(P)-dependent dehydrogenase (short-subunit alcohol dehydrogenase family)